MILIIVIEGFYRVLSSCLSLETLYPRTHNKRMSPGPATSEVAEREVSAESPRSSTSEVYVPRGRGLDMGHAQVGRVYLKVLKVKCASANAVS
jgi:hypothetical protein